MEKIIEIELILYETLYTNKIIKPFILGNIFAVKQA